MPNMTLKSNRLDTESPPSGPSPCLEWVGIVESRDLLGRAEQVQIRHEGRLYCLRRTRLGKLILTA